MPAWTHKSDSLHINTENSKFLTGIYQTAFSLPNFVVQKSDSSSVPQRYPNQSHLKIKNLTAVNTVILLKLNASKILVHNLSSFRTLWRTRKKLSFTGGRNQAGEGSCLPTCQAAIYGSQFLFATSHKALGDDCSSPSALCEVANKCLLITVQILPYPHLRWQSPGSTYSRPWCQWNHWWQTLGLCLLLLILTWWFLHCW